MSHAAAPYRTARPRLPGSGSDRPERSDDRAARMLGCSPDRAKRLRLWLLPESITAILTACLDDSVKRESFRRVCLTALSAEPAPDLTPDLILEAAEADAREDVSRTEFLIGEPTESERLAMITNLRAELAAKTDLLRALEARSR